MSVPTSKVNEVAAKQKFAAELLREITATFLYISGNASSITKIADSMPTTPLVDDDTFCPELVFPALGAVVIRHAEIGMELVERVESLMKETNQ